jgi:biopolymer transport protein ExbD
MINITSLVDVMFILLLFLMVSTTFRQQLGVDITLPKAATAAELETEAHEIAVTAAGQIYFGDEPVDEAGLRARVEGLLHIEPEATLVLRADESAAFGPVLAAIDVAREAGGNRLVIPTRPKRREP